MNKKLTAIVAVTDVSQTLTSTRDTKLLHSAIQLPAKSAFQRAAMPQSSFRPSMEIVI